MESRRKRHGGLVILGTLWVTANQIAAGVTAAPAGAVPIRSQQFEIDYRLSEGVQPIESVVLWYTRDDGQTWRQHGADADRTPPVVFAASEEGRYGFFVVVRNAAGASSPDPAVGTPPLLSAFVDYTPPLAQLRFVQPAPDFPRPRELMICWTAYDAHLPSQPVALSFRRTGETTWTPIVKRIANTGRYDWPVPPAVVGTVHVKLTVRDRVGHVSESVSQAVPLAAATTQPTPAVSTTR